ncbi:MAG TPA: hypothetical protein VGF46_02065 [Gaiellales bacterium]
MALIAGSTISDQIVGAVAIVPALLVCVVVSIALLSADLVRPRSRVAIACSALSIVAPFPFLVIGRDGIRAGAVLLVALQVIPLFATRPGPDNAPRRTVAALAITTAVLLITVAALVWYGAAYLVRPPTTTFSRSPYLVRVTTTEAALAWKLKAGEGTVSLRALGPDGSSVVAHDGVLRGLRPDTRYLWTANIGGSSSVAGSFHTAPTSTASPITLVAFGDYGSGNAHEYAVGRLAAAVDPALMLSAGDNSYLLAAPPLLDRAIFAPLRPLLAEAPMVAALGEHDLAWDRRLGGHLGAPPARAPLQRAVRPRADRRARASGRCLGARVRAQDARTLRDAMPRALRSDASGDRGAEPDHVAAPRATRRRDPGRAPAPLRAARPLGRARAHDRHRR